jgi:hypothetical protein
VQAKQAANDVTEWDWTNSQITLGTIGVVTRNTRGRIKTRRYASRNTTKGAKMGLGLDQLAAVVASR